VGLPDWRVGFALKTDMRRLHRHVGFVPKAEKETSLIAVVLSHLDRRQNSDGKNCGAA
jgi:hypothetical protein